MTLVRSRTYMYLIDLYTCITRTLHILWSTNNYTVVLLVCRIHMYCICACIHVHVDVLVGVIKLCFGPLPIISLQMWRKRWFVLLSSKVLEYYKSEGGEQKGVINLEDCHSVNANLSHKRYIVCSCISSISVCVHCTCSMDDWLTATPEGSLHPRELCFADILMYMYIVYMYTYIECEYVQSQTHARNKAITLVSDTNNIIFHHI